MSAERVRAYLAEKNLDDHITIHPELIDTVEHAAEQIGCSEAEIAMTLSFLVNEKPVIIVMAGDAKVNSSKFKAKFHTKPHMIPRDMVNELIGHEPGGVCPFAVKEGIPIYLDESMKRFHWVHPAAGDSYTSATFTLKELETAANAYGWCDVCNGWEHDEYVKENGRWELTSSKASTYRRREDE